MKNNFGGSMLLKILIMVALVLASISAQAAWSGKKEIKVLKVQNNGVYLKLKDFSNSDDSIDYSGASTFILGYGENNYQAKLSFLLAAYMSGQSVNVSYYGCAESASNQLDLGSVSFE